MSRSKRAALADALILRRVRPSHRAALLEMYRTFEPKSACLGLPPHNDWVGWVDRLSVYRNVLALAGDRVVGHAVLCPSGDTAEVAVFVHQAYRGCGVGKRLLAALIAEAGRLDLGRLWGVTEFDNLPMLKLLHSFGFIQQGHPPAFTLELPSSARIHRPLAA